ncbi:MAG: glycosyltransferase, partial [Lachnospiraceae bacterium]|nr:glycosyltransferase [Lachnospiraceae bacterium]
EMNVLNENDSKMKVLLLNDSFPPVIDGVANTVMNYAKILTESEKAEAVVATPKYPDGQYDNYPYRVIPYKSFDTTGIVNGYRAGNPLAMQEVEQMLDFSPDIIHSHCPAVSTIMARLVRNQLGSHRSKDVPLVFTYHTKFDVDIARAMKAEFMQKEAIRMLVSNIDACDDVWVVSQGAGENLRSLGYQGDYRVVSNGVDFPKGRIDAEGVAAATAGYDLPEGIPVFLFVGRLMKYKGLPIILDALKICAESGMDFRMVFIGGGVDAPEMVETAIKLGLSVDAAGTLYGDAAQSGESDESKEKHVQGSLPGKVIFTGAIHDRMALRAWNTRADLFLFPSTYDTNGIVVREAAACGLASVLIKDSCASEGITDDRNGFLIEENAQSMAALLMKVGKDIPHMAKVGQGAMDEIYISWEESVFAAHDRYGELLEMMKSGELKKYKKDTSDYILDGAAHVVDYTGKIFRLPHDLYSGMIENVFEVSDRMYERSRKVYESREAFVEEIRKSQEELAEEVRNLREQTRANARELGQKTKEGMRSASKSMLAHVKEGLEWSDPFSDN